MKVHVNVPPEGFAIAVRVVVWFGRIDAGGFAEIVTVGTGFTVSVAGFELITLQRPVSTTLYVFVFIFSATLLTTNVLVVAPAILTHAVPFHCCHW